MLLKIVDAVEKTVGWEKEPRIERCTAGEGSVKAGRKSKKEGKTCWGCRAARSKTTSPSRAQRRSIMKKRRKGGLQKPEETRVKFGRREAIGASWQKREAIEGEIRAIKRGINEGHTPRGKTKRRGRHSRSGYWGKSDKRK